MLKIAKYSLKHNNKIQFAMSDLT